MFVSLIPYWPNCCIEAAENKYIDLIQSINKYPRNENKGDNDLEAPCPEM